MEFTDFYPLSDIANLEFVGDFDPTWSGLYTRVATGSTSVCVPEANGCGLRLGKLTLKRSQDLPQSVARISDNNLIYAITSTKYPILYVGITEKGLRGGILGSGRLAHHIRKLLAVPNGKTTNHTIGWHEHAVTRYDAAKKSATVPAQLCIDIRIAFGNSTTPWKPADHEGYVLSLLHTAMQSQTGELDIAILNTGATKVIPIDLALPSNMTKVLAGRTQSTSTATNQSNLPQIQAMTSTTNSPAGGSPIGFDKRQTEIGFPRTFIDPTYTGAVFTDTTNGVGSFCVPHGQFASNLDKHCPNKWKLLFAVNGPHKAEVEAIVLAVCGAAGVRPNLAFTQATAPNWYVYAYFDNGLPTWENCFYVGNGISTMSQHTYMGRWTEHISTPATSPLGRRINAWVVGKGRADRRTSSLRQDAADDLVRQLHVFDGQYAQILAFYVEYFLICHRLGTHLGTNDTKVDSTCRLYSAIAMPKHLIPSDPVHHEVWGQTVNDFALNPRSDTLKDTWKPAAIALIAKPHAAELDKKLAILGLLPYPMHGQGRLPDGVMPRPNIQVTGNSDVVLTYYSPTRPCYRIELQLHTTRWLTTIRLRPYSETEDAKLAFRNYMNQGMIVPSNRELYYEPYSSSQDEDRNSVWFNLEIPTAQTGCRARRIWKGYSHIGTDYLRLSLINAIDLIIQTFGCRTQHWFLGDIPGRIATFLQSKQSLLCPRAKTPPLPQIEISSDDPPAFLENPLLKKMYDEDSEQNFPTEGKGIDIESLLACYIWDEDKIILWGKGIELCARGLCRAPNQPRGVPYGDLFECILVHELGHWFNAMAVCPGGVQWERKPLTINFNAYGNEAPGHPDPLQPNAPIPPQLTGNALSLSSRCYHEAWAQWFAWLYGHEKNPGVLQAFESLEQLQSTPYQAWRKLVNNAPSPQQKSYTKADQRWPNKKILGSLTWSRSRRSNSGEPAPATFFDVNFPATNMIDNLLP